MNRLQPFWVNLFPLRLQQPGSNSDFPPAYHLWIFYFHPELHVQIFVDVDVTTLCKLHQTMRNLCSDLQCMNYIPCWPSNNYLAFRMAEERIPFPTKNRTGRKAITVCTCLRYWERIPDHTPEMLRIIEPKFLHASSPGAGETNEENPSELSQHAIIISHINLNKIRLARELTPKRRGPKRIWSSNQKWMHLAAKWRGWI